MGKRGLNWGYFWGGGITSPDVLKDLCRDADGIIHRAAIPSVLQFIRDPVVTNEVNVIGTFGVLVVAPNGEGEEGGVCVLLLCV